MNSKSKKLELKSIKTQLQKRDHEIILLKSILKKVRYLKEKKNKVKEESVLENLENELNSIMD